ncbi:2-phosphoglycerate kinase [soil metagenome]
MKRHELRVKGDDTSYAFSVGEIVESLQGVGVPTDEAIRIARGVEKYYRGEGAKSVKLDKLVDRVARTLAEVVSDEAAERFRVQTPPFVPLEVQSDETITPFSKRLLAKSLEQVGLRFKEAHAVAGEVEQGLRSKGYRFVSKPELRHLVALALEGRFGRDARIHYESQTGGAGEVQLVEESGALFPFSRGILAQSMMAIGLGPELSYTFAKHLENVLLRKGLSAIDRDDLHREVKAFLLEEAGEEFARRFDLMRSVRRPDKPILVLIGGAPGVGKSSLAAELAYRLGIRRVVSSDAIREALRSLISPQLSPSLHRSSFTAWRSDLLPSEQTSAKPKRKRVTRGFQGQAQQLGTALTAIVERSVVEAASVIVEGIHLAPGLLALDGFDDATVLELVLVVADEAQHRRHFASCEVETRSKRSQDAYLDHFEEIRMIHDYLAKRAQAEGVPVVEAGNFDEAVERVLELVLDASLSGRDDPKRVAKPERTEHRIESEKQQEK